MNRTTTTPTRYRFFIHGRRRKENPNFFEPYREKLKVNISESVKNSVKLEKRIGSSGHKENKLSEDTKKKISDGLKKYYSQNENNKVNIEKHQESMTRAVGKMESS